MAVVQSTYATGFAAGFPGQVANGEEGNRISRIVEDSAGMAFGVAAFRGTGDNGVTATPSAGKFMGIVIANHGIQPVPGGVAADIYPQYASAPLLNEGEVFVTAGHAVTAGEQVYVTAGGVFTDVSTSNTSIPAWFDDSVASGAIVRLRVRKA